MPTANAIIKTRSKQCHASVTHTKRVELNGNFSDRCVIPSTVFHFHFLFQLI